MGSRVGAHELMEGWRHMGKVLNTELFLINNEEWSIKIKSVSCNTFEKQQLDLVIIKLQIILTISKVGDEQRKDCMTLKRE